MVRHLLWGTALGLATALGSAQASPLEVTQEALGADQVRILVSVGTIGELSDWLALRDIDFTPERMESSAAEANFSIQYDGGYLASAPVPGSFDAGAGLTNLDLVLDPDNQKFGMSFSYSNPAPLANGTVLMSFVIDRPAAEPGGISVVAAGVIPIFQTQPTDDEGVLPGWAGTTVAAVVPEPSAALLMMLGLAGVMLRRRTAA